MKQTLLILFFTFVLAGFLKGQTGGDGIFTFLQLTNSAKAAALGGVQVALPDPDPELILQNPALLSSDMNNSLSVNYVRYLADIGFGYGCYARDLGKYGRVAIGIQFVDYGQFVAASETGQITGSFSASDYALTLTYAKQLGNHISAGVTLKPVYSHLESYRSFGFAADLGISHQSEDQLTNLGLCFKNLGAQLTTYYDGGTREKLVGSLQLGFTHQLQHAPFRWSVTAYDLTQWDTAVTETDPNGITTHNEDNAPFPSLMRHLALGAEIFPENKLTLRFGYNYRRHADLSTGDQTGLAGFTTGLGIKTQAFRFNYSLSGYSRSGLVHNFSITASLSHFRK